MVSGQHGQTGRTVAKVVKMELGPELAAATSPPLLHMVNLVLGTRRKLSLATRTCVQVSLSKLQIGIYNRLSLSQNQRDPLKHCEVSVLRHIRFVVLRKKLFEQPNFTNDNVI